mmetsp:Transcript_17357/g.34566  ORF Transcript_17357/g.34566 Transcript_17357/m.34566 type:complete len:183 (+) Transcript_17357:91-639(+)
MNSSLQDEFTNLLGKLPPNPAQKSCPIFIAKCNEMIGRLELAGQTHAIIVVWDAMGGKNYASSKTWVAIERLHSRGKGRIPAGNLILPEWHTVSRMAPERRLHKICKGRVLSQRSSKASDFIEPALLWLRQQRDIGQEIKLSSGRGTNRSRFQLIRQLQTALNIDKDTARGLVTKLKQKKLL